MRTTAPPPAHSPNPQRGAATLFMTVVLLLAVGLIALYTNRAAIMEQHLAANETRAKQAFAAANAGIDYALAYLRNGGLDHNGDSVVDTLASVTLTSSGGHPSYYTAIYCDSVVANNIPACPTTHSVALACTAPAKTTQIVAVSCGWSDDDSSVQRIVQALQQTPSVGGNISVPVIARGTTNLLTGGASVLNYFNDLTVWTGGSFNGQSNTGKTFIRDIVANPTASVTDPYRSTGNSPACNNPPAGYVCSTQGSQVGLDVVYGDSSLSNLTTDGFFQSIFNQTPTAYRDGTAGLVVDLSGNLTAGNYNNFSTSINSVTGTPSEVIWVEGSPGTPVSLPTTVGSQTFPVVLVINGDLDLGANTVINGLVYVTGNITGNGTPTIYGALISAGSVTTTGNPKVIYDPKALGAASNIGMAGKVQGSWRDW